MRPYMLAVPIAALAFASAGVPAAAQQQDGPEQVCAREYRNGAVDVCREALEANPDDLEIRRRLAIAYQITGAYEPSLLLYEELARRQPQNALAQYEYAYTAAFMRRYPESVEPIERAIRLEPENIRNYKLASIIYSVLERYPERYRVTVQAAEMGDPISMFEVAHYIARGEGTEQSDDDALEWLRRAANAGHVGAMDRLAQIYLNGEWGQEADAEKAAEWANRALEERGGN